MNDVAMQYIAHWYAAERDWSFGSWNPVGRKVKRDH